MDKKHYGLALRYLGRGPKTVKQIRRYLAQKSVREEQVEMIITRLEELNYLDDRMFARQFIDNRIRYKPRSKFALRYELRQKGISSQIADEFIAPLNDVELACAAVEIKATQWQHFDEETRKKKFMNHLRYRGFSHGVCMTAWSRFGLGKK